MLTFPLLFLIGSPLVGVGLMLMVGALLQGESQARIARLANQVISVLNLGVALAIAQQTGLILAAAPGDGPVFAFVCHAPWVVVPHLGSIDFILGVDGINMPLLVLTALVSAAAAFVAPRSVERPAQYFACLMAIQAGSYGAFASLDLIGMFFFHELALIPTFLLVGFWGNGPRRAGAAFQMAVYLLLGSMVLLIGMLALVFALPTEQPTTNLLVIRELLAASPLEGSAQSLAFLTMLLGFGVLVGLFPFYSWAPQTYSAAPVPAAMLHAGVLKKFGIYGLLRVAEPFLPGGMQEWSVVAAWLIAGNLLILAWVAMGQRQLPDLLGYSSLMHMGYLFLGLLAATQASLVGVVLLMVGHGLSVAGLFAVSGMVQRRTGTVTMSELGGLATKVPLLGFAFTVFAMASIGLPGLANFAGEVLIFLGSWERWPLLTALGVFGVVLSAIYMLRAVSSIFHGPPRDTKLEPVSVSGSERMALVLLMTSLLVLGLCPSLVSNGAAVSLARWNAPEVSTQ